MCSKMHSSPIQVTTLAAGVFGLASSSSVTRNPLHSFTPAVCFFTCMCFTALVEKRHQSGCHICGFIFTLISFTARFSSEVQPNCPMVGEEEVSKFSFSPFTASVEISVFDRGNNCNQINNHSQITAL